MEIQLRADDLAEIEAEGRGRALCGGWRWTNLGLKRSPGTDFRGSNFLTESAWAVFLSI
jgi:hypothetical protein